MRCHWEADGPAGPDLTAYVRKDDEDAGSATAELALLMPSIVMILVIVLAAGTAGLGKLKAIDGAEAAARQLARGETTVKARATARRVAGPDAHVKVDRHGRWLTVEVKVSGPDFLTTVLPVEPHAVARTRVEDRS